MSGILMFLEKIRLGKPWRYKIPLIMSFAYQMLFLGEVHPQQRFFLVLAGVLTSIGFAGFGYVSNDVSDMEKDRLAGKANSALTYGKTAMMAVGFGFIALALLPWWYLPFDVVSLVLIASEFLLFALYALPPVRLKERGFSGIVTDALYAYVVPAVLASWTFLLASHRSFNWAWWYFSIVAVWMLFAGIRNVLNHQLADSESDQRSGMKTFVLQVGIHFTGRLIRYILLPLEFAALLAFIIWVFFRIEWLTALLLVYVVYALVRYHRECKAGKESALKIFTNVFLDEMYVGFFPLLFTLALALQSHASWFIFLLHFLLFQNVLKSLFWRMSEKLSGQFPFRLFPTASPIRTTLIFFLLVGTCSGILYILINLNIL